MSNTTIDNALKTFASYFAARHPAVAMTRTLELTRHLSKSINACVMPMTETKATLWNAAIGKGSKPTKLFGVSELRKIWIDLEPPDETEETVLFYTFFGALLDPESDDFPLIWAPDGGQAELQRRAKERVARAEVNRLSESEGPPRIEEISETGEADNDS